MRHTHRKLHKRETARSLLSKGQVIFFSLFLLVFVCGVVFERHYTAIACITAALLFYTCFVGLKVVLWKSSGSYKLPAVQPVSVDDQDLPVYTLLIPLYKEARVLKPLVEAIKRLEYPVGRLEVLLLIEEDDMDMQTAIMEPYLDLPAFFKIVSAPGIGENISPKLMPRGKPRALNIGLEKATGAFCVVYDAEDRPDPDQLLKAVAAFRAVPEDVACLQARLFFWNEDSSWVTRFYWAEYVVHFEWTLTGLAKLGLVPPLGGTSNHFRTDVLRKVAIEHDKLPKGAEGIGGWDPWNVTEDAELAGALAMAGYKILMIDSVTQEEATASLRAADKQRRRWLKGYLQTGLVFTRRPIRTAKQMGFRKWFCYNLLMLGTPLSLLLNPVFWGVTVLYFATRTMVIERLFPLPLYYTGILLMVAGNLLLFYQLVVACLRRGGYGSVKFMLLTPLWWAFTSYSCLRMILEIDKRVWYKTEHGHDMHKEVQLRLDNVESSPMLDPA